MKQEIKFRMWDKKKKRMYEFYQIPDVLKIASNGEFNLYDLLSGSIVLRERFILMQFTGLRDKNGKEIYEGDILAYPDKRKKKLFVVEWIPIAYCEEYGTYAGFRIPEDYKKMVVVGNVYETRDIMSNINEDKIVSSWLELKEQIEKMKGEKRMRCKLCEEFYREHPLTDGKHTISSDKNLKVLMTPIRCGFKNGVFTRNNWREMSLSYRCGFRNGVFTRNNWNCQTLIKLREIAESIIWDDKPHPLAVGYRRDDFNSASIGIIQIPKAESDEIQMGYIVLTWYKNRGKTGNAIVICDDYDIEPLTLKTAEWVIKKAEIPETT